MADDIIRRLAIEQRKRLVAGILNSAEKSAWWSRLRPEEQRAFRDKVLDSVGVYHDFMLDVIKVSDDDPINEHALTLLEQVRVSQRRVEAAVARRD